MTGTRAYDGVGAQTVPRLRPHLVRWPSQADQRLTASVDGVPCLLVIERGATPPPMGPHEDWILAGASERDVAARLEGLALRPAPHRPAAPPSDVPAAVGPQDARTARTLLGRSGHLVPRAELGEPDEGPASLDAAIGRIRRAIAPEGWTIHRVGSSGFLARRTEAS